MAFVIGVDEAGLGCIAGPMAVTAFAAPAGLRIGARVDDSKRLTAEQRTQAAEELRNNRLVYHVTRVVSAAVIDMRGVRQAWEATLREATLALIQKVTERGCITAIYFDGNWCPSIPGHNVSAVIGGDASIYQIAAASILAKTSRDAAMLAQARHYPEYGFADHKGYGTLKHVAALKKHGAIPGVHRFSYAPVKAVRMREPR